MVAGCAVGRPGTRCGCRGSSWVPALAFPALDSQAVRTSEVDHELLTPRLPRGSSRRRPGPPARPCAQWGLWKARGEGLGALETCAESSSCPSAVCSAHTWGAPTRSPWGRPPRPPQPRGRPSCGRLAAPGPSAEPGLGAAALRARVRHPSCGTVGCRALASLRPSRVCG